LFHKLQQLNQNVLLFKLLTLPHCFLMFRTQGGMWTVLLSPMLSITFDPKLKVKELTNRKRTRKMRAGLEKWV